MTQPVALIALEMTCGACPSQWDARDDKGQAYYIRYRWGCLTVEKDEPFGELVLQRNVGGPLDGSMTTEEMLEHTGFALR